MSVSFNVAALSGDQVPLAFPLIQATWPSADLASWQSFVEFFNDQIGAKRSGVLALRDPAGSICGVLAYRLSRDLQAGPILAVHLFTAVDLQNSLRTVRALLDAANMEALKLGCTGVQIRLRNDQTKLASRLRSLGMVPEASLLSKRTNSAPTRN
jgi:hypothetical protein